MTSSACHRGVMRESHLTGSPSAVERKSGQIYSIKARERDGHQNEHKLGPVADRPRKQAGDVLRDFLLPPNRAVRPRRRLLPEAPLRPASGRPHRDRRPPVAGCRSRHSVERSAYASRDPRDGCRRPRRGQPPKRKRASGGESGSITGQRPGLSVHGGAVHQALRQGRDRHLDGLGRRRLCPTPADRRHVRGTWRSPGCGHSCRCARSSCTWPRTGSWCD